MLDIAEATFTIGIEPLGEAALRAEATRIFDEWDSRLLELIPLPDYALYLELEEGSLKGKGRIGTHALALLVAIEHADGILSGLERIHRIGKQATSYLVQEARTLIPPNRQATVRSRRSAGDVGRLESLFVRVRNREIDPHDAAEEAARLLENEPDVTPEMLRRLADDLRGTPKIPQQLVFELYDEREEVVSAPADASGRKPRAPGPPRPETPAPNLFRVEIVRDSRRSGRRIKVDPI